MKQGQRRFFDLDFEKIRDHCIEPFRLVPLHPVSALVEQVKFGVRDELKEQDSTFDRDAAVLSTPQEKRLFFPRG